MQSDSRHKTSRKHYLEILSSKRNVLLIGPYKAGKTLLLREFLDMSEIATHTLPASTRGKRAISEHTQEHAPRFSGAVLDKNKNAVYIDFAKISLNPENFAAEFVCKAAGEKSLEELYNKRDDFKGGFIEKISNELQKIKPDQRMLVEWAFCFANSLGRIELLIDNFEEFLGLNNYSQIKDAMSLFFSLKLPEIRFVLASCADIESIFSGHNYLIERISAFDKKETKELAAKIIGRAGDDVFDEIFELSKGYPYYIYAICSRYKETKNAKEAYEKEAFSENGLIYNACRFEFFDSLSRARGQTLLKTVLKVLSENGALRLNEISRKIYRSSPVTQSLLLRLISVGLISKDNRRYTFTNLVLKEWARHYFSEDR